MAVKRVVTVRAENGASTPPAMESWEQLLGMEWRFSGVSTGHTDGVKPPLFHHTYQLVEPDDGQEAPASTTGHPIIQEAKKQADIRSQRIRAWILDTSAPMEERKARLMQLLPLEFVRLAGKIEIDGVCLKDRGESPFPTPIPGEVCSTCDGNNSACPVCNPTEPPEGYLD